MNKHTTDVGYCPSCGQETVLVFLGIQYDENEVAQYTLWYCTTCRGTISGRRIEWTYHWWRNP